MKVRFDAVTLNPLRALTLVVMLAGVAAVSAQTTARAPLQVATERKAAPNFKLKDASGKTVKLSDYRGKVVLLDFWATWCTGCKEEIPWFSEFQSRYRKQGFAVVGVSMDDGGWKVLKPFLDEHKVPYRMLLGDEPTARRYEIADRLPDTFLIDRQGRVAAAYTAALVDRDDVEGNINALLSKR
jgi:peroxiredoxin